MPRSEIFGGPIEGIDRTQVYRVEREKKMALKNKRKEEHTIDRNEKEAHSASQSQHVAYYNKAKVTFVVEYGRLRPLSHEVGSSDASIKEAKKMQEYQPCWYELSWLESGPSLILRVHKDFVRYCKKYDLQNAPGVLLFNQEFNFEQFNGNLDVGFGFDNALGLRTKNNEWIELEAKIPEIVKLTDQTCSDCHGSGKRYGDPEDQEECFFCKGTGKQELWSYQKVYALSASLNIFFILAHDSGFDKYQRKNISEKKQLFLYFSIQSSRQDFGGGAIYGKYSSDMHKWLCSFPMPSKLDEVRIAMLIAHKKLFSREYLSSNIFRADISGTKGSLTLCCGTDAAGIYGARKTEDDCYEFFTNNIDTKAKQIILLSGLAALHDKARREM